jgi:hypothetical protein
MGIHRGGPFDAIDIYVHGFAPWEARFASAIQVPLEELATSVLRELSVDDYPRDVDASGTLEVRS